MAGALLAGCASGQRAPAPGTGFLNQALDMAYVGQDACRRCHMDIAASYRHTGMGRAFYPLTPETAVEDFRERNVFEVPGSRLRYRMEAREDGYYQVQFLLDEGGRERMRDERRMLYVLGSGNHARSYVTEVGGGLYQLPVCWYPLPGVWDFCPGFETNNDHFTREIDLSCVFCHNGRMVPVAGKSNVFQQPIPHGIGCERCHGPGALHVEKWRSGEAVPMGGPDPTIVHPRRLAPAARIELCMQCHLGDSRTTERVQRIGARLVDYRPGRPFTEFWMPFYFARVSEKEFGLSAQADRLLRSRCYTESGGRLECLTCHNPHVTVYAEDRPPDLFRERCLSCHAVADCTAPMARRRGTAPEDDCVSCHMRTAEPDDQRHATFTDHWIRRDIERLDETALPMEMVPVFPDAYRALPAAERAYYEGRAYMLAAMDFPTPVRRALWAKAEPALRRAVEAGLPAADAAYFLGKLYVLQGRWAEAAEMLARAVAVEPQLADAAVSLAAAELAVGRTEQAIARLEAWVRERPGDAAAQAELGRALVVAGRAEEAVARLERAAAAAPASLAVARNLAVALGRSGRMQEARRAFERALRIDPDEPELWEAYAALLEELGDTAAAADAHAVASSLRPPAAQASR